jgi:hypothetical protein
MPPKKHAPVNELKQAAKEARKILAQKKIILPDEQSAIRTVLETKGAPPLPGLQPYLPFVWTLNIAKSAMFLISKDWLRESRQNPLLTENVTEFFKYVVKRLDNEIKKADENIKTTVFLKQYNFKTLHQKEAAEGLKKFIVDSFAIAVIVKKNDSVSDYITWFDDWTTRLYLLWQKEK